MLTLAFAQITWSVVFQWDALTGGSNGVVGVWPSPWLASRPVFYLVTLAACAALLFALRRIIFSPYGYALRAARDSPVRAEAIGIDVGRSQWAAFIIAGVTAGAAGAIYAFSKGSISPETLSIARSVDALVMVLLGGLQTLLGPLVGASVFTWLQDIVAREVAYWRGVMGLAIIAMVIAFPQGIAGFVRDRLRVAL
jgi:branched-chain amino acid transport system permease protein